MLEEIEFHRLAKLRLEVDEPDELCVLIFLVLYIIVPTRHTETLTADYLPMKNLMIVSRPKQNAPFSLWIASNTTRLPRTIR